MWWKTWDSPSLNSLLIDYLYTSFHKVGKKKPTEVGYGELALKNWDVIILLNRYF